MQKYIKDGMVAVLYSPGFGAGWFTWNSEFPDCMFHPDIVELVIQKEELDEQNDAQKFQEIVQKIDDKAQELFGNGFYTGGSAALCVEWMHPNQTFRMREYDGSESIEYSDGEWLVA